MSTEANSRNLSLSSSLQWFLLIFLSLLLLYLGKVLFAPLAFGLLIALVLYPISAKLERKGLPRCLSIALVISFLILLFIGLICLLGVELNMFLGNLPSLSKKLSSLAALAGKELDRALGISPAIQGNLLQKINGNLSNEITWIFRIVLHTTASTMIMLVMIPIYATLLMA